MRIFTNVFIAFLLLIGGRIYSQNFSVSIPKSDSYGGLLPPIKAGTSFGFQINLKNITTDLTCTVSIDKSAMTWVEDWISIENNSLSMAPGCTATFNVTVNVPASADDVDYPMPLYFNAYDANNNNHTFDYTPQTIIVDKSVPDIPTFSANPKSSSIYVYSWQSFDSRSSDYTDENQSSGINGIKTYNVKITNTVTGAVVSKDFLASENNYYTFGSLASNTQHTVTVTASDIAGNVSSSSQSVKTAPTPPTLSLVKASYCYINLSWSTSTGATKYELYNATSTPAVLIATQTGTNITLNQSIAPNSTYKYFVKAINSSNVKSDDGNTLVVPTPALASPILNGNPTVCTSGTTFTVSNLPTSDCSLTWTPGSYLSLYSSSGNTATFKATGAGATNIKATFQTTCASANTSKLIDAGSPKPGAISIEFDAPPNRFTASINPFVSATSYKWYLDGVLKFNNLNTVQIFQRQIGNCGHIYNVDVALVNLCGTSAISHTETSEPPCLKSFTIYPNPATSDITIASNENLGSSSMSTDSAIDNIIISVKIVDNFGMTYISESFESEINNVNINISALQPGSYLLIIDSAKGLESYQFLKK